MTIVSNSPAWWPVIHASRSFNYCAVAAFVIVTYDWALTFELEVELIWKQRWSPMTVLYLSLRYLGISYATLYMLCYGPIISLTDTQCLIIYFVQTWTGILVFSILCVIIIARLHAMYQGSKKILIFLIIICTAVNGYIGVAALLAISRVSGEELILSGTYQCAFSYTGNIILLFSVGWILSVVWEVLVLCFAVWIALKHLRELRQFSARGMIGDCLMVLMKTHVLYFASFVAVSCFILVVYLCPILPPVQKFLATYTFNGLFQISEVIQRTVLGPRLILNVREYYAKRVANSNAATDMASIAFQERVHISTGSGV